ncbi:MAG: hypothetical protein H0V76_11110 [Blastocatellia bacterium]|nr:hypothetical protein [Blastocatellia bacterium]
MQGTRAQQSEQDKQGEFSKGTQNVPSLGSERDGTPFKETVADKFAGAADIVHDKADIAQNVLAEKADRVNEAAHNAIEKINYFGHKAAEKLERSSDYVKDFDFAATRRDITAKVGEKPELSLAIAGIFGLIVGLFVGRRRR